jgi:hypothetical protein
MAVNRSVVCLYCGEENPAGSSYCRKCGKKLKDPDTNLAVLAQAWEAGQFRQTFRSSGGWSIFWGIVAVFIGISSLSDSDLNFILILIGGFLFITGIAARSGNVSTGTIVGDGLGMVLIGVWNILITISNMQAGSENSFFGILGVMQIIWGIQRFTVIPRFQQISQIPESIIGYATQRVDWVKNANLNDRAIFQLTMQGSTWKVGLESLLVTMVTTDGKKVQFTRRNGFRLTAQDIPTPKKQVKVTVQITRQEFPGTLTYEHWQRYESLAALPPPVEPDGAFKAEALSLPAAQTPGAEAIEPVPNLLTGEPPVLEDKPASIPELPALPAIEPAPAETQPAVHWGLPPESPPILDQHQPELSPPVVQKSTNEPGEAQAPRSIGTGRGIAGQSIFDWMRQPGPSISEQPEPRPQAAAPTVEVRAGPAPVLTPPVHAPPIAPSGPRITRTAVPAPDPERTRRLALGLGIGALVIIGLCLMIGCLLASWRFLQPQVALLLATATSTVTETAIPTPTLTATITPTLTATPTQTAIPTQTATRIPTSVPVGTETAQAVEQWEVLYSDSFDTNQFGFHYGDDSDDYGIFSKSFLAGKYHWEVTALQGVVSWELYNRSRFGDFAVSVDARFVETESECSMGIVFRSNNNDDYYLFSITNTGFYALDLLLNGNWVSLLPWTFSEQIDSWGENKLEVSAVGDDFTFWINGKRIGTITDSRLDYGYVGVAIMIFDANKEGVFEFDNFVVKGP